MLSFTIATLCKEHMYVFFCQMPKTKARSGAFQKGADVWSIRRQGHGALHHFETAHSYECIGHYKKRHTHAPFQVFMPSFWNLAKHFINPKWAS
jgi:hypothetical protein